MHVTGELLQALGDSHDVAMHNTEKQTTYYISVISYLFKGMYVVWMSFIFILLSMMQNDVYLLIL